MYTITLIAVLLYHNCNFPYYMLYAPCSIELTSPLVDATTFICIIAMSYIAVRLHLFIEL